MIALASETNQSQQAPFNVLPRLREINRCDLYPMALQQHGVAELLSHLRVKEHAVGGGWRERRRRVLQVAEQLIKVDEWYLSAPWLLCRLREKYELAHARQISVSTVWRYCCRSSAQRLAARQNGMALKNSGIIFVGSTAVTLQLLEQIDG